MAIVQPEGEVRRLACARGASGDVQKAGRVVRHAGPQNEFRAPLGEDLRIASDDVEGVVRGEYRPLPADQLPPGRDLPRWGRSAPGYCRGIM